MLMMMMMTLPSMLVEQGRTVDHEGRPRLSENLLSPMNSLSNLLSMNFVELPFPDELVVELLLLKASTRKLLLFDELDVDELLDELLVDHDVKLG